MPQEQVQVAVILAKLCSEVFIHVKVTVDLNRQINRTVHVTMRIRVCVPCSFSPLVFKITAK